MFAARFPRRYSIWALVAAGTLLGGQLAAQAPVQSDSSRKARIPLFTLDDALLGLGFAGLTIAMFPVDKSVARRLRIPSSGENKFIGNTTTGVEVLANPGALVAGSAMYLLGRTTHHRNLADVGLHTTESIVIGSTITLGLKGILGRSRPFVSNGTDPKDFGFGKGFGSGDRQSFPSGHTTTAFAAASSITSEVQHIWPKYTWVAGPVMYGTASMVGLARMYHNKHWASDVALGAAIGTFSGLKVVRYAHNHPGNRFDRLLLEAVIEPNGDGGQLVGLTVPW
ncbi:MAG: phosphatase PAP2 family protein [Gemmatimonadales bacterium]